MKMKIAAAVAAVVLTFQAPGPAQAFECPKHFAGAQAVIDKVTGDISRQPAPSPRCPSWLSC